MCFKIRKLCYVFLWQRAHVAKKDIICYKHLYYYNRDGTEMVGPFYNAHVYKIGKSNPEILLKIEREGTNVYYNSPGLVNKSVFKYGISAGYHSILYLWKAKKHYRGLIAPIFKCVISKGSIYYIDWLTLEVVSSNIIIKKVI